MSAKAVAYDKQRPSIPRVVGDGRGVGSREVLVVRTDVARLGAKDPCQLGQDAVSGENAVALSHGDSSQGNVADVPPNTKGPGQVGKQPSNPTFLFLVALMWIGVGVVILLGVHASWKLIPGIVSLGIGVFFLRGAAATVARRNPDN
jgi:hypothetical protein